MAKPLGWKPLTSDDKQAIVRRYAAGETMDVLAEEYGRARKTVRELLKSAGVPRRPTGYAKGSREWTPEWREAHLQGVRTPANTERARQNLLKRLPSMRGPATNTPIEQRLQDALIRAGIGFTAQSQLLDRYLVDIEVRQARIVIEADGSQHSLREQKAKDVRRDAELVAAGYRVFRFTGSALNRDALECVKSVIRECGLTADEVPVYEIRTRFAGELHPRWKGGKREFTCDNCGGPFLAQPSHRRGPNCYCSQKCAGAARRGKPRGKYQNKRESALHGDVQRSAEMTGPAA